MSAPTYNPSHTLSALSKERKRNLFVWRMELMGDMGFLGGLHLKNSITVSTLYRWIELILTNTLQHRWTDPVLVPPICVELYPIELEESEFCQPHITRRHDVLDRKSNEPLLPGDLGVRPQGGTFKGPRMQFPGSTGPMLGREEAMRKERAQGKYPDSPYFKLQSAAAEGYSLSDDESKKVLQRDIHCVLTGAATALTVTWIYPPWLGIKPPSKQPVTDLTPYLNATNALTLHTDVANLFRRNQLGIDVDDNYRVVDFRPDVDPGLPSQYLNFSSINEATRPSENFLRRHFRHTLQVQFLGGDAAQDYPGIDPEEFTEEHRSGDPEWVSQPGKQIFEQYMKSSLTDRNLK